ncbi:MAG: hypothetical protein H0A75_03430 [Candidatus Methanofishera endochildressiae]|uniref:Uncharacterized protein n=1 Tax=Candidatus Methanofishera endochildressiae TaxID=2738884 RepID=A0A7Z0SDC6_9GAMM|nr:hypothetical protein [Candidatus Methanofishera endochildressiae]
MPDKKGGSRVHISQETIIKALKSTSFNQTAAAKVLEKSRTWFTDKLREDGQLREMYDDARELVLDGNFNAIKFVLSTRGRSRGYGTDVEVTSDTPKPFVKITSSMSVEESAQIYRDFINEMKCPVELGSGYSVRCTKQLEQHQYTIL